MQHEKKKGIRFRRNINKNRNGSVLIVLGTVVMAMLVISIQSIWAAAPSIGNFSNQIYVERSSAIQIAPGITISGDNDYSDSWMEFELSGGSSTETLGIIKASSASIAKDAVSIVGTGVFLGDGTEARQIGSVDVNFNGENGKKLRINFSSPLQNAQFTEPVIGTTIPGWTVNNNQVYPSTVSEHQALFPRTQGNELVRSGTFNPFTMSRPGIYSYLTDVPYSGTGQLAEGQSFRGLISSSSSGTPGVGASFQTSVVSDAAATGGRALRLFSAGWLTTQNPNPLRYGSAFGPEVYSEPFTANAGDQLALNWRASGAGDDYEVYGYLLNTVSNARTLLFYGRGGTQAWTTATGEIPESGTYKFHFINGSFDRTGGYLLGAEFFIDNIRVLSSVSASDAVVQAIARSVTYHNSSCTPQLSRTITARTRTSSGATATASASIQITPVNCAPNLTATARNLTFKLGSAPISLFSNTTATDPEGDLFTSLRFTVSGMLDGVNEKIVFDNSSISLIDGQTGTTSNGYSYSVSGNSPSLVTISRSGVNASTLQTTVNNMAYTNTSAAPTPGSRTVTLTYLSDNGGTANGGIDHVVLNIPSAVTVVKADQSINFATLTNKTYGDSTFELNATASSGLPVEYTSSNLNVASISGNTITIVGAGSVTITASQGGNDFFNAVSSVSRTFTVAKKGLTVTADNQTKQYGDTFSLDTTKFTSIGLVNGDSIVSVQLSSSGTLSTASVGNYSIAITGITAASGTNLNNYSVAYSSGILSVTRREISVKADDISKVYGNADPQLSYKITSGSLLSSDGFSGSLTRASGVNVGEYAITRGSLALSSNYNLNFTGSSLTITPRAISVAVDSQSKIYGTVDPQLTYRITSGTLVSGDGFSGSLARASGVNVGEYAIGQGTLALNSNYTLSLTGNVLTITPRAISVAVDSQSKIYGAVDPQLTYKITSGTLVSGDSFVGNLSRALGEDVGNYVIGQGNLALGSNYTFSFIANTLTITPRAISVAADSQSKVYGEVDPQLTYKITSGTLVSGDSFVGNVSRALGENVGNYVIGQGNLALSSNYTLSFTANMLTITPRAVSVAVDSQSKVYGEVDPQLTYKITSGTLVSGDDFSGSLARASGVNVGEYVIGQGNLSLGSNYTLSLTGNTLTISPRAVSVAVDSQSKTYGEVDPQLTYTITSGTLVSGDDFIGSLARASGVNVGEYAIGQGTLALSSNYTLSLTGNTLTITPRSISVEVDSQSKTYGEVDPQLTYTITSGTLVSGDSFSGTLIREVGEGAGNYIIEKGTLSLSSNYSLDFTGNTLTIMKRAISVAVDSQSKTYGNIDPQFTYRITSGTLVEGDSFSGSLSRLVGEDVGEYMILNGNLTLGGNYSIDFTSNLLTIEHRVLTIKINNKRKVYGDIDPIFDAQYINLANNDTSDVVSGLIITRETGSNVGNYAVTPEDASAENYIIVYEYGTLEIERRPITITATMQSKMYGSADPRLTFEITDGLLVNDDDFIGNLSRESGENVGVYAILQDTVTLGDNYEITFIASELEIEPYVRSVQTGSVTHGNDINNDGKISYVANAAEGFRFAYWSDGKTLYSTSQILEISDLDIENFHPVFWPLLSSTEQKAVELNTDKETIVSFNDGAIRMILPPHHDADVVLSASSCDLDHFYGSPKNMIELPMYYCLLRSENLYNTVIRLEMSLNISDLKLNQIDISNLRIFRWNETEESWELTGIVAQGVDEEKGIIWAEAENFSAFGVFSLVSPTDEETPDTSDPFNWGWISLLFVLGLSLVVVSYSKKEQEE